VEDRHGFDSLVGGLERKADWPKQIGSSFDVSPIVEPALTLIEFPTSFALSITVDKFQDFFFTFF
jgi:hypothetical protein